MDNQRSDALVLAPCDLQRANAFVRRYHRHHGPVQGYRFALACATPDGIVHGVAVVGRPLARHLDDGWTLEVTRLCTDGTANAASFLLGAAWRAARALGYRRIITYTLPTEGGASLRAAGWVCAGEAGGDPWNHPGRPRRDRHPLGTKLRWERAAGETIALAWGECDEAANQIALPL